MPLPPLKMSVFSDRVKLTDSLTWVGGLVLRSIRSRMIFLDLQYFEAIERGALILVPAT